MFVLSDKKGNNFIVVKGNKARDTVLKATNRIINTIELYQLSWLAR